LQKKLSREKLKKLHRLKEDTSTPQTQALTSLKTISKIQLAEE
jgi:hypothetical protein